VNARRLIVAAAGVSLLAVLLHVVVVNSSRLPSPYVTEPHLTRTESGGVRRAGRGSVRTVGKILEVRLAGTPDEIGTEHAVLLHDEMVQTESVVWELLDQKVPNRFARTLLLDAGSFEYRHLTEQMDHANLRELAASARAFRPDPFADRFDTFQRFVYLHALYDISLGYERSPLVGCTTFTFSKTSGENGPMLARAFDFDAHDIFDEKKAVFLVRSSSKIPFASVAWPGLVGVVTGMNRAGLAVVVHGARAGETHTTGEPVVAELRRLLENASTTTEAVHALAETDPLVSHIVAMNDADGHAVAVERVPGAPPFVRELGDKGVVTNHLEGPFANDAKNQRVRSESSTLPRRARGDELMRAEERPATAMDAVRLLRDRDAPSGAPLPLGDRRAIDALIATHSVVMETRTRRLWVSEAPHSLGKFVAFDLEALFDADDGTDAEPPHAEIAEDPMLTNGTYAKYANAER
jgi:isopenicillin-N N-acyltransferase-like protein